MHPVTKHVAAGILALGTALSVVPSPARAALEQGLIQPVQYYRYYHRHRYYGGGYYHRPYSGYGPGFYRRGYYRYGHRRY